MTTSGLAMTVPTQAIDVLNIDDIESLVKSITVPIVSNSLANVTG